MREQNIKKNRRERKGDKGPDSEAGVGGANDRWRRGTVMSGKGDAQRRIFLLKRAKRTHGGTNKGVRKEKRRFEKGEKMSWKSWP